MSHYGAITVSSLDGATNKVFPGTEDDDLIVGTDRRDMISSYGGNDTLFGKGGNDTIEAGAGNDTAYGGIGDDYLEGGPGMNTIDGGRGYDWVSYNDATAGVYVNLASGHAESIDSVDMLSNIEAAWGSNFNDTIYLNGAGIAYGMRGDDMLYAGSGNAVLDGGAGHDWLYGGAGRDMLTGGSGRDWLQGGGNRDTLDGGIGSDVFLYAMTSDSTGKMFDTINNIDCDHDKMHVPVDVTGVDASIDGGRLRIGDFDSDLMKAVNDGNLAANHAVLFMPDKGSLAGMTFLIVDQNGVAGYQAASALDDGDLVIALPGEMDAPAPDFFI
jgi:Ca2+-binding RTX toxin-like protein